MLNNLFMAKKQLHKKGDDKHLLELIAAAAENKQATDIKILDISNASKLVDYLIICSVESDAQLRAIEKEINRCLRLNNIKGFRWQGIVKSGWLLLDLGTTVVHLMREEQRNYYDLEGLWGKEAVVYHC